jgi:hypothetical protein
MRMATIRDEQELATNAAIASCLVKVTVPAEIDLLDDDAFSNLRRDYEGIRLATDRLIRGLGEDSRLGQLTDPRAAEARFREVTEHFETELTAAHQSKWARRYDKWVAFPLTQLLTLTPAIIPNPAVSVVTAGGTVTLSCIDRARNSPGSDTLAYRNLASLKSDIGDEVRRVLGMPV